MHKDNLTFRVVSTNAAKNTVTLRPTFGTIVKMNVAAGAVIWCAVELAKRFADRSPVIVTYPEHEEPNS